MNATRLIIVVAALIALVSARPYAGSWNDGSRLATVESLVDRNSWTIDDSIYVRPPVDKSPYTPGDELLARHGTGDKMFIRGHFYSDKSPVPALTMAFAYQSLRQLGLPSAADRPDQFARWMTWIFAVVPFVVSVWAIGRSMTYIGTHPIWSHLLLGSFAMSWALPYAQHVNNHILLLAFASLIAERMLCPGEMTRRRTMVVGLLCGAAYATDLGAGPPLMLAIAGLYLWRRKHLVYFSVSALPLVLIHHAINYGIGGSLTPSNANPEYFRWPGSPFSPESLTGGWNHPSLGKGVLYSLDLLVGKKGVLLCSLPLMLAVFGSWKLFVRRANRSSDEMLLIVAMIFWSVATWLLYSATSRNHSGVCVSIRWFLPLLVPGYLMLALLVRDVPQWRSDLLILVAGSMLILPELIWRGPWSGKVPYAYWPAVGIALSTWGALVVRRWWRARPVESPLPVFS